VQRAVSEYHELAPLFDERHVTFVASACDGNCASAEARRRFASLAPARIAPRLFHELHHLAVSEFRRAEIIRARDFLRIQQAGNPFARSKTLQV